MLPLVVEISCKVHHTTVFWGCALLETVMCERWADMIFCGAVTFNYG